MRVRSVVLFSLLLCPAAAAAQGAEPPTAQQDEYVYQPGGRRDPFLNLLGTGVTPPATPVRRGDGTAGLLINEIAVRGVMQSGGAIIAMVQGPDGKHHIIRAGDKLVDGSVKAVTLQGLVLIQNVSDPLSKEKRREVRKPLNSAEESQ